MNVGIRSLKSCRRVNQPSITRNTSPCGSSVKLAGRAPRAVAWPWSRCRARRTSARVAISDGDLGDGTLDPVDVEPAGDAADVRQAGESGQRAAAEVEAVELHLARGVGEREAAIRVRSSVLLPLCGPPAMPTWPPAPDRSTISRSRSCSNGLSTKPTGTAQAALPGQSTVVSPRSGSGASGRQQLVQRRRRVQRRQPDLVGRRSRGRAAVSTATVSRVLASSSLSVRFLRRAAPAPRGDDVAGRRRARSGPRPRACSTCRLRCR